jgi:hypothetical protein
MPQVATNGRAGAGPARPQKPRCEDCFFFRNELCALEPKTPCPTFRPWHPDGLRPPQQLAFVFRTRAAAEPWLEAELHDEGLEPATLAVADS